MFQNILNVSENIYLYLFLNLMPFICFCHVFFLNHLFPRPQNTRVTTKTRPKYLTPLLTEVLNILTQHTDPIQEFTSADRNFNLCPLKVTTVERTKHHHHSNTLSHSTASSSCLLRTFQNIPQASIPPHSSSPPSDHQTFSYQSHFNQLEVIVSMSEESFLPLFNLSRNRDAWKGIVLQYHGF